MKRTAGITLGEVILVISIVLGVLAMVFWFLPAFFQKSNGCGRRPRCMSNLEQIGRTIGAYYSHYNHHPFFESRRPSLDYRLRGTDDYPTETTNAASHQYVHWPEQRPDSEGDWSPGVRAWWATDSLTLLYPEIVANINIFKCPETEDDPRITVDFWKVHATDPSTPQKSTIREWVSVKRIQSHFGVEGERAKSGPHWSSYGYNNRIAHHSRMSAVHVIAGDMDHTAFDGSVSSTSNHQGGGNFLFYDGSVRWSDTRFIGQESSDDVFRRQRALGWDDWDADTDAWLRR